VSATAPGVLVRLVVEATPETEGETDAYTGADGVEPPVVGLADGVTTSETDGVGVDGA
jgi:hypothetical protein